MPLEIIRLTEEFIPEAQVAELGGTFMDHRHYRTLVSAASGPVSVYMPDGRPLLHFRPGRLPLALLAAAQPVIHAGSLPTENRGMAAPVGEGKPRRQRIRLDGTPSNQNTEGAKVLSGVAGFFEGVGGRNPACRMTAFTRDHFADFGNKLLPVLREMGAAFAEAEPERHAAQMGYVRRTLPEWVIDGTPFTTVTLNRTFRTALHTDKGDLDAGFSCITAVEAGERYEGGFLVFPRWGIAVDLRTTDFACMDAHQWHGNTELLGRFGRYTRYSIVAYYREGIVNCKTAAEEKVRAERSKEGRRP